MTWITRQAGSILSKWKVQVVVTQANWTFLSNHCHVLICIARQPEIRMREIALCVGITERAVQRIVADLVEGRYLMKARDGRRNRYDVQPALPLRHPIEAHCQVQALLALLNSAPAPQAESG